MAATDFASVFPQPLGKDLGRPISPLTAPQDVCDNGTCLTGLDCKGVWRTTGCRRREIEQFYEAMFLGYQCVMTKFVKLYKTWGLTL